MGSLEVIPLSDMPPGEVGKWRLEVFEISEIGATMHNMRAIRDRARGDNLSDRTVRPGTYRRLICKGRGVIMSDTDAERRDHALFVRIATGNALVTGLGMGLVASALAYKKDVKTVTVVEVDPEVVELTGPWLKEKHGDKIRIVTADAYRWKPNEKYDWAWHDVWDTICGDNMPLITKMKRHYEPSMRAEDRQMAWVEAECRYLRRHGS